MITRLTILLFFISVINCFGQTYEWGWSYGDVWGDYTLGTAVSSSNELIVLSSRDTNNFDPAHSTYLADSLNGWALSIRDSNGVVKDVFPVPINILHKRQFVLDNDDNLIIAGEFFNNSSDSSALIIGNDSIWRYSDSSYNCILKMNLQGDVIWFKTLDINVRNLTSTRISTDQDGYIYLTSIYSDSICYYNGQLLDTCYINGNLMANKNLFVQKITSDGSHLSIVNFENNHFIEPECIKADVNGNIYISGYYTGIIDFNPDPHLTLLDTSRYDSTSSIGYQISFYLLKLNRDYSLAWAKTDFYAPNFILDHWGNLLFTRGFAPDIDIDPGPDSISFNTMDTTWDGGGTALVRMNAVTSSIDWMHGYSWLGEATDLHLNSDNTVNIIGRQSLDLKLVLATGDIYTTYTPYPFGNSHAKLIMNVNYHDGIPNWAGLFANDVDTGYIIKDMTVFGDNGDIFVAGEFNHTIDINPFDGLEFVTCNDIDPMPTGRSDNFIMKIKHHLLESEIDTVNIDISVYPNPTKGQISIGLNNLQNVEVDVYDIQGRLMYHDEGIFENQYHFNLTANNGIYLVRVKAGHHIIAKKIIML